MHQTFNCYCTIPYRLQTGNMFLVFSMDPEGFKIVPPQHLHMYLLRKHTLTSIFDIMINDKVRTSPLKLLNLVYIQMYAY